MGAALRQQPVDFIRAECPGQPVQFGSLLLHELIGFCFSLPVRGFSEHIVVLLALVDQQSIDFSQLAEELLELQHFETGDIANDELLDLIEMIADILGGMKEEFE